ncbi:MAG: hypothetical protein PHZ09_08025 [Eubacteriales bacterium]|nr:hypothetical protein [Eubacteriales bacterium]
MNKKMNRICCLLIPVCILICGCVQESADLQTDTETQLSIAPNTDMTAMLSDNVGDINFDGAQYRVLTGIHSTYPVDTYSREESGDLLDDALFTRNMKIEERFNIDITETVLADIFQVNDKVANFVLADDNAYEMLMMIDRYALAAAMKGYLLGYNDLPYLDLDMPYWNQNTKKDFSIDGKLFFTYGDDNLVFFGSTTLLAFNKNMMDSYNLENPYQLVYDGKWTYDKYAEMNHAVTDDKNGDGVMNIEDQWGSVICANQFYANFWLQDGYKLIEKDENDLPYFNVPGNDDLISCMTRLAEDAKAGYWYDLHVQTDYRKKYNASHEYNAVMDIFADGKALFVTTSLVTVMDVRGMETNFGILPFPATDEKDPGYVYGSRTFGGFPYVVPVTADPQIAGAVMEAAACDSHNNVIPVLYDKVLKIKNTRDEDSERMLDMIRSNRITDLGEVYWWDNVERVYEETLRAGNTSIASKTESISRRVEQDLETAIGFFKDLSD